MNRRISYTGYSLSTFFEGGRCGVPRGESPPLAERGRDLVLDGARVEEYEAARSRSGPPPPAASEPGAHRRRVPPSRPGSQAPPSAFRYRRAVTSRSHTRKPGGPWVYSGDPARRSSLSACRG